MIGCSLGGDENGGKADKNPPADGADEEDHLTEEAHMLATLNVLTRCMNLAEYFCQGALDTAIAYTEHYALHMAKYTHFTSPIRRYADVIVHRQLASILADFSIQCECGSSNVVA